MRRHGGGQEARRANPPLNSAGEGREAKVAGLTRTHPAKAAVPAAASAAAPRPKALEWTTRRLTGEVLYLVSHPYALLAVDRAGLAVTIDP